MSSKNRLPHVWKTHATRRGTVTIPWPVCRHCGLVRLNNERTDAAVRVGCDGRDGQ